MSDRLTGIEVFVLAVRRGGLSAAARELGLSPTMASRHLDMLEQRLGATLLHRTTRRLSLTEAGTNFLAKAERILEELSEAEAEASSRSVTAEGVLRVSAPAAFGLAHLAPLFAGFVERHPRINIDLGLDDRYVDLLQERWDMAIRIGHMKDSSLIAKKLVPVSLVICAAPHYLALHGTPKTTGDLKDHACLSYTLSQRVAAETWAFGKNADIRVPVKGPFLANNGLALIEAAKAGMGLVLGPRFLADEALARGSLHEITLELPLPDIGSIHAVTHPARLPAAKTRAFIDYLAKELSPMAGRW
ncbi:DNA-binding transcriptional LysR family regulator [Rhizomicrobium palustre]|uniref:DNA-binding transcriptional LysR family regulator n=1 Tax=Rhizomicrobium palustre TaxID=189966 RepID=A0A846N275_9PROT|nr:LysR family transcriptional regulator [Rhizomicrobium palustre]NIK89200.1 DNA-binding transcriptional LysR family regulator [Rhizomicrobium palustre]